MSFKITLSDSVSRPYVVTETVFYPVQILVDNRESYHLRQSVFAYRDRVSSGWFGISDRTVGVLNRCVNLLYKLLWEHYIYKTL